MAKKCPNCAYECNDDDKFCSQCGYRLIGEEEKQIQKTIETFRFEDVPKPKNNQKIRFSSQNVKKIFENTALSVSVFLVALLCAFCFLMYFILDNHNNQKEALQYKNLLENPSLIPLLKEPLGYSDLAHNMKDVESFLTLYLKNSSDNQEKKDAIFSNYLKELDKLPNVLNEKFSNDIPECSKASSANSCAAILSDKFSKVGIQVYGYSDMIYLYPDYKFIKNKYSEYLSSDFKKYVSLRAKYNYPVSFALELNIKPNKLADKIADYESLFLKSQNEYIQDALEKEIYRDIRKFIFTPSIYSTVTQEMKIEYKKAYIYFIKHKKNSALRALIMSYLDKKRSYSEENFENDYVYKKYDFDSFDENVKNSVFDDIFVQLRKNIFANQNANLPLAYVYTLKNAKWSKYSQDVTLEPGQYVISEPDENNNISIFNHAFSPMQELNIMNYSKMYLISDGLYIYNSDKLSISKITFNGKIFNLYTLNHVDITSLFPGVEVINIDAFPSYNILIQKDNTHAAYILISKYSQGWHEYSLDCSKGDFKRMMLPNMFSINSNDETVLSFHTAQNTQQEFSESKPDYKFIIRTRGYKVEYPAEDSYAQYDEKTKDEEEANIIHKPNIMPKLNSSHENTELEEDSLLVVPEQKIDPPKEAD